MKLYTKHGDDGSTGLIGGPRVAKDNLRVATYGDVDETNAAIGLAASACDDPKLTAILRRIQGQLFELGTQLATPTGQTPSLSVSADQVAQLEHWIDEAVAETTPLRNFILPGGTPVAAGLHHARTVCRRAERAVVTLARTDPVGEFVIPYLNRLSDLLFALARVVNHRGGVADIPWSVK